MTRTIKYYISKGVAVPRMYEFLQEVFGDLEFSEEELNECVKYIKKNMK